VNEAPLQLAQDKLALELKRWQNHFSPHYIRTTGKLTRLTGITIEAVGISAPIGSRCLLQTPQGSSLEAEVVGFADEKTYLMCIDSPTGLAPGIDVTPIGQVASVPVGEGLLGRVIDGRGEPLDDLGTLDIKKFYPLVSDPINPLARSRIADKLDVGVRAINGLLTVGCGQRLGLFAGSGVGKSVLLGMMTRFTKADVIVVGLIGERGREVKSFIEESLGAEGLARSVVVAVPADQSPLQRLHGAMYATSLAEYYRDQGKQVLLLMDSLTRFAQAQREIGLAIGEPPTTKGYPPSVFTKLSQLVERTGPAGPGQGSITAFYTVLTEGDDQQDPIADAARAILDGHIVLSRKLAERGHYPAIDIEASISRVMPDILTTDEIQLSQLFKRYYAKYHENSDLINIGAYQAGSDPELDQAIKILMPMNQYLRQGMHESARMEDSLNELAAIYKQNESGDGVCPIPSAGN